MIQLFAPSTNDQSMVYLYTVFGSMSGVIPVPGGTAGGSTTMLTLLGTMFKTFNSVALAVGALIVVYVTVVGVMNTAHEGKFMGKDWNNLWIPIRTVLGIAALVPTGSGYSGLQIIMMWVILQGIGAADTLWSTVLTYVNTVGSPFAQVTLPSTAVKATMGGLFKGIVCAKSAAATYTSPYGNQREGSYFCGFNPNDDYCRSTNTETFAPSFADPMTNTYAMGPGSGANAACGILTYCSVDASCKQDPNIKDSGPNSLKCITCKAQVTVLKQIIPTLAAVADKYVLMDYQYSQYWVDSKRAEKMPPNQQPKLNTPSFVSSYCSDKSKSPCSAINLPSPSGNFMSAPTNVISDIYWKYGLKPDLGSGNFVDTAINYYLSGVTDSLNAYMANMINAASDTTLKGPLQEAKDNGWILAGSYYHIIARQNNKNLHDAAPEISYDLPQANDGSDTSPQAATNRLYGYRNNYSAADQLICVITGGSCGGSSQQTRAMNNGVQDANSAFVTNISNKGATDPLAQLTATGYALMFVAGILFMVFMVLVIVLAVVSAINFMALGTGMPISPAFPLSVEILMLLIPLFFMLEGMLISIGALLGIYVPLIPYIIFTVGAIGWLISTVEAMVAGPLVALGIISPSGHHELLGKAEPALGLLFGIFLRPSLMIFGMMAAMLLSSVVVQMVNAGFYTVYTNLYDFSGTGSGGGQAALAFNPVAAIMILIAYVNLIVVALNKTFSAIYIIPERTLSWIGIQIPQEGAGEALGEMKGGISGGAGQMGGAMKTGGETAKGGGDLRKMGEKQDAADVKAKANPPVGPEAGGEGPTNKT